jgi:pyruvate/2-oxoglutarate dehydrogenase complex dihydrolipoamide dehydrogenase (E3) component
MRTLFAGRATVTCCRGGTRLLKGEQAVINVGTHAAIPDIPRIEAAHALTHIEALLAWSWPRPAAALAAA